MIRIICCGNRHRGDDGAGVLVAEWLRDAGIAVEMCTGETTALLESWSGAADVIVVDAVRTGAAPGTVHAWNGWEAQIPGTRSASTHGFGVGEAIALARKLGRLPAKLRIFGIEASSFEVGTGVSPKVKEAAENLAQELAAVYRGSQNR
ncbi:MAG TPA: hydrogenase maturation protease [Candidatus Sulfotelmatobacter sp.]|nr:hydrogenase maturation protease [Candidatus Sulfotelmatobacter sp.]